ncbi:orotidine-5'-phosphate decarboxylase [Oscillospiraceae bacterium OttesenSCG-928-F05]|nr:orotidine-5'-phosphate decarboxylase [Oscillospiraceae bacterium OttesenSCG-928-F05]
MDRLIDLIRARKNPTVAGLDPKLEYIPKQIVDKQLQLHGETLKAAAEAVFEFNAGLIDALKDIVPAVKPQSAYYERLGPDGVEVLRRTIAYAKEAGLYVIADCKRNDIGSTAEAYAEAYLGSVTVGDKTYEPFGADSVTINPYLGSDGIKPFYKFCTEREKTVFVLCKTSNPSSLELQDMIAGDRALYRVVAGYLERWGKDSVGKYGFSSIGAVVGATHPAQLKELRKLHPSLFFLVPGYGAQGGSAADIEYSFNREGHGAIVNSSRGIMCAWQKKGDDGTHFAEAARDEAVAMRDALKQYITIV